MKARSVLPPVTDHPEYSKGVRHLTRATYVGYFIVFALCLFLAYVNHMGKSDVLALHSIVAPLMEPSNPAGQWALSILVGIRDVALSVYRGFQSFVFGTETLLLEAQIPAIVVGVLALLAVLTRIRALTAVHTLIKADDSELYSKSVEAFAHISKAEGRVRRAVFFFAGLCALSALLTQEGRALNIGQTLAYSALVAVMVLGRIRIPELFLSQEVRALATEGSGVYHSLEKVLWMHQMERDLARAHKFYQPTVLD